ncbi:hypothetical protein M8R19_26260 [Pseudomonas sp. R3.Fl]|jgi:hypothetical protein|uniref:hypothetical protein n=1 Tax=Pseudomonas TaxID=286 RepID=UPI00044C7BA3|nr:MULTISPECIES: hypothetical protein [Pseudomonas]MDX4002879.1 hypothetical protein [Pseudomonas aeruginosa]AMO77605.1 hypothetical protein PcP3B5_42040 [Pseudomonas citronellolis]ETU86461.1 hypothetical protein Q094_04475 [Pseudomonas aeruginosa PS42]MCL6692199.1 hypothetical protein [Pseudomonas sp. R3.Fl]MDN6875814.1 hypothetical protein [Pseudomonas citronellolis]
MTRKSYVSESDLAERIFEEEHFRDIRFAISYFIPHFREYNTETFFLAYWPEVVKSRWLLDFAAKLPFDVREIKASRKSVATARASGITSFVCIPVNIESMYTHAKSTPVLKIVLSDERMYLPVKDFLSSEYGNGFLHISTAKSASKEERDFSPRKIGNYAIARALALLEDGRVPQEFFEAVSEVLGPKKKSWKRLAFPGYRHGLTYANELIAESLCLDIVREGRLMPSGNENYIPAILRSSRALWGSRSSLTDNASTENRLCISVEPILWRIYKVDLDKLFPDGSLKKELVAALRIYVNSAVKSENYIRRLVGYQSEAIAAITSDSVGKTFISLHRQELELFNISLGILGLSDLFPIIRIEPKINKIKGDLINLANCARGNGCHANFKLNKLGMTLKERMLLLVDKRFLSFFKEKLPEFSGVSIVTDLPLEWLPLRGLPLMLRCDVSRIPATPGNINLLQTLRSRHKTIALSDFDEILIVRSFSESDKIKYTLETTLQHWTNMHEEYPKYRIVDIESSEEFVAIINSFKGALMIFDGHGSLKTDSAMGSIIVGGEELNVWELQSQINMPPIVLLSACDTIPVDGGHGATASGMLALGAMTVLGTLLPVNAVQSASFIARLLFRMSMLLPMVVKNVSYMPWRGLMSGMLRMTFCTELIENLINEAKIINIIDRPGIQLIANNAINSMSADWYEQVVAEICKRSVAEEKETVERCKFWGSMVDTLKYTQLGRPENIKLRSKNIHEAADLLMNS